MMTLQIGRLSCIGGNNKDELVSCISKNLPNLKQQIIPTKDGKFFQIIGGDDVAVLLKAGIKVS